MAEKGKKGALSRLMRLWRHTSKRLLFCSVSLFCPFLKFRLLGLPRGVKSLDDDVAEVIPAAPFSPALPQTIEEKIHSRYLEVVKKPFLPGGGLLEIPHGVALKRGLLLDQKHRLISTYFDRHRCRSLSQYSISSFSRRKLFPKIHFIDRPLVALSTHFEDQFFHWMFDVLGRLPIVEKGGIQEPLYYCQTDLPFQKESLEMLEIPEKSVVNAGDFPILQAPWVYFPSILDGPTRWGVEMLLEKIGPKLSKKERRRLYISRKSFLPRYVVNEEEVMEVLEKHGFERVELSEYSFKEQAELFYSAEAVVGPHGAGLTHLLFCEPETPCLEFFSPDNVRYYAFWTLANLIGLPYFYLFGEGEAHPDPSDYSIDPNIFVDPKKLEASLKRMGFK